MEEGVWRREERGVRRKDKCGVVRGGGEVAEDRRGQAGNGTEG